MMGSQLGSKLLAEAKVTLKERQSDSGFQSMLEECLSKCPETFGTLMTCKVAEVLPSCAQMCIMLSRAHDMVCLFVAAAGVSCNKCVWSLSTVTRYHQLEEAVNIFHKIMSSKTAKQTMGAEALDATAKTITKRIALLVMDSFSSDVAWSTLHKLCFSSSFRFYSV